MDQDLNPKPLFIRSLKLGKDRWVMILEGPVDSVTYDAFDQKAEEVLEQGAHHILLDMAGIQIISTSGLDVIFGIKKTLEERGGSIAVFDPGSKVRGVFEIVRLLHLVVEAGPVDSAHPFYDYLKNKS